MRYQPSIVVVVVTKVGSKITGATSRIARPWRLEVVQVGLDIVGAVEAASPKRLVVVVIVVVGVAFCMSILVQPSVELHLLVIHGVNLEFILFSLGAHSATAVGEMESGLLSNPDIDQVVLHGFGNVPSVICVP